MIDVSILRACIIEMSEHLERFSADEIAASKELLRDQEWLDRANKIMASHQEELTESVLRITSAGVFSAASQAETSMGIAHLSKNV